MKVVAHSYVSPQKVCRNGQILFDLTGEENGLKVAYQQLKVDYPKFYKMDPLSKMAFIGVEVLVPDFPPAAELENDLQLLFANASASLYTDNLFVDSYQNKQNPSPSLFVYTLPNIVTGELSIRHKWYGENSFFIEEDFQPKRFVNLAQLAFNRGNKWCLGAWVEAKPDGEQECFLFLLSHSGNAMEQVEEELSTLIKQYRNE